MHCISQWVTCLDALFCIYLYIFFPKRTNSCTKIAWIIIAFMTHQQYQDVAGTKYSWKMTGTYRNSSVFDKSALVYALIGPDSFCVRWRIFEMFTEVSDDLPALQGKSCVFSFFKNTLHVIPKHLMQWFMLVEAIHMSRLIYSIYYYKHINQFLYCSG